MPYLGVLGSNFEKPYDISNMTILAIFASSALEFALFQSLVQKNKNPQIWDQKCQISVF